MNNPKGKITGISKGIIITMIFVVLIIVIFTMLSFIPIMGEIILFDDVDVIDLSEIVIFCSIFIGILLIFILFIVKYQKSRDGDLS